MVNYHKIIDNYFVKIIKKILTIEHDQIDGLFLELVAHLQSSDKQVGQDS